MYERTAEGSYRYFGRTDDLFKVGGEWVSPTEVEAVLMTHAAVLEAAVIGVPRDDGVLQTAAFVTVRPGETVDAGALIEHCRPLLAGFKRPRQVTILETMPKTATGKVRRVDVRAMAAAVSGLERFSLAGKRALVTGASRGIGLAIARELAACGADVALAARSLPELEAAAGELRASGRRAVAIACDVLDADSCEAAVEAASSNSAASTSSSTTRAGRSSTRRSSRCAEAGWHKVIDLNLTSAMRMSQLVGRHLCDQGSGSVINITSPATSRPWPAIAAYSAAKAAVLNLTQVLAQEWAERGVRVNALSPGWIRTEINRAFLESDDASAATAGDVPLGRWGDPDDVVGARCGSPRMRPATSRARTSPWTAD